MEAASKFSGPEMYKSRFAVLAQASPVGRGTPSRRVLSALQMTCPLPISSAYDATPMTSSSQRRQSRQNTKRPTACTRSSIPKNKLYRKRFSTRSRKKCTRANDQSVNGRRSSCTPSPSRYSIRLVHRVAVYVTRPPELNPHVRQNPLNFSLHRKREVPTQYIADGYRPDQPEDSVLPGSLPAVVVEKTIETACQAAGSSSQLDQYSYRSPVESLCRNGSSLRFISLPPPSSKRNPVAADHPLHPDLTGRMRSSREYWRWR